ncbi:TIGR01841 family phasin [Cupriavidus necator]|uniref:TIGR01841 family phasin n=1 Tax=Cupriavidus necator TaxID=106590 RepID=UPI0039C24692
MPTLPTEPISAVQAAGLDILLGLTNKTLEGLQKVVELNLQMTRATLAETQQNTRQAFAAKDLGELLALQASLVQLAVEKAQSYRHQLFEIASATQAEFTKVADAQYEESKRKMQEIVDNALKGAPAGSQGAVAAWQSALTATTTLCDTMQQTTRQALELAESNLNQAADAASVAAQEAGTQATRAAKR